MSINLDNITTLPEELNYKIFSLLDPISLGNCCQVSKKYNELASNDNVWKDMFPNVSFPSGISAKKYMDSQAVTSFDGIFQRIKKFSTQFFPDKVFKFNVLFPFNLDYYVSVRFGYGEVSDRQEANVKESCIFVKKLINEQTFTTASMALNDLQLPIYRTNSDEWEVRVLCCEDKDILISKLIDLFFSIKNDLWNSFRNSQHE